MTIAELRGEHAGQQYVAHLREKTGCWHLDSLFIGDLPSQVEEPSEWPTQAEAAAALAQRVARYIDEQDLHPTTLRERGVPMGGG
jgi:hypothetical protein